MVKWLTLYLLFPPHSSRTPYIGPLPGVAFFGLNGKLGWKAGVGWKEKKGEKPRGRRKPPTGEASWLAEVRVPSRRMKRPCPPSERCVKRVANRCGWLITATAT
jgi:hypothetical protein